MTPREARRLRQDISANAELISDPGDLAEGVTLLANADIYVSSDEAITDTTNVLYVNGTRVLGVSARAANVPAHVGWIEKGKTLTLHEDAVGVVSIHLRNGVGTLFVIGLSEGAEAAGPIHWEFGAATVDIFVSHGSVTGSPTLLWTFPGHGTESDMENDITGLATPCTLEFDLDDPTALVEFNIEANYLSGTMPDTSGCTNLISLDVSGNEFTGAVSNVSPSVEILDISSNQFTSMQSFASLTNLIQFACSYNSGLTELPSLAPLAATLTHLSAEACGFVTVPSGISSLVNLISLQMTENYSMEGSFPDVSALVSLVNVVFSDTMISGALPDFSSNVALQTISAGGTALSSFDGSFPDTLTTVYLGGAAFDEESIDNILSALVAAGASDGTLYLADGTNSAPSAAGLTDKATLESRGWTVTVTE